MFGARVSTYATTATVRTVYGDEVYVNRNLLDTEDGDVVRVDTEAAALGVYLTREQAVELGNAILEAASAEPTPAAAPHAEDGAWDWTCPGCGWHARDVRLENHLCPAPVADPSGNEGGQGMSAQPCSGCGRSEDECFSRVESCCRLCMATAMFTHGPETVQRLDAAEPTLAAEA